MVVLVEFLGQGKPCLSTALPEKRISRENIQAKKSDSGL